MKQFEDIPVNIEVSQLVSRLSREDAFQLIEAIDLRFAECDFTLSVLKTLVKSLESDMSKEEIKQDLGL
jgi:hypothetical protein